jgi:CubicO group peptidase (beta-lactamase class C family)
LARNLLEDLLRGLAKSRQGKQAIVAVDAPNQSFRWIGSVGKTEAGEPVVENTPFFIASIDKLYNATIAMMLAESGKLDVDQSICSYLPETITRGLHQYGGRVRTEEITLRHLLTHTSGLPDWFENYPKGGSSLAGIVFEEGDRRLSIEELTGHVRDRLRAHFPPQDLTDKRLKILAPMPAVFGHTGSTGCWLFYCPELEVAVSGSVEDAAAGTVPFRTTPRILKLLSKAGWQTGLRA